MSGKLRRHADPAAEAEFLNLYSLLTAINATLTLDLAALATHAANTSNPHSVTLAQVGGEAAGAAGVVQGNLNSHTGNTSNPHSVTLVQVGGEVAGAAAAHALLTSAHGSSGAVIGATTLGNHTGTATAHGVSGSIVGTTDTQGLSNKTLDSTNKFGGAANYTAFEADGTMVAVGAAQTWDDSQAAVVYMKTGGTSLTLDVLDGGISQWRYDKNDEIHSQIQLSHRYKPGTALNLHLHLINKAAVGATNYNVGIEIEYMWGSINSATPAAAVLSTFNCSFQSAAALTHKVFDAAVLTPSSNQGSISSILIFRIKRVAGTSQDLAGNNIFLLGIDVHVEQDTLGSRAEYVK